MSEHANSTGLPNVNAVGLAALLGDDNNTVLAKAVRRLAAEVARPNDPLAAFTSYVEQ